MHRLILKPKRGLEVDHKDRNGLNNQRCNLRPCTRAQNMWNTGPVTGKYKGVSYQKNIGKWNARISYYGLRWRIGFYETEELAAEAVDCAAVVLHGEFAYLNFPDNDYSGLLEIAAEAEREALTNG